MDRKLAVGEGVVTENVQKVELDNLHLCGFRIGVKIQQTRTAVIRNSLLENCSIGISVVKSRQQNQMEVVDSIFKTMYYGVMGENTGTVLTLQGSQFIDVPKALLLCQVQILIVHIIHFLDPL